MKIYAKFENPNAGRPHDVERAKVLSLYTLYEVKRVEIGQSNTTVYLRGFDIGFNSVQFSFCDERAEFINIFKMKEFNPYI